MSKYYGVLGLILCLISTDLEAQYQNLKFESYSTLEGLSSSTCTEIFQDSKGFMWFGTIDGLNKFDGYEFTIYRPQYGKPNSLGGNRITAITEDENNKIWIGTTTGLSMFDQNTEQFHRIDLFDNNGSGLTSVNCLLYQNEKLWVGTASGLVQIDLQNENTFTISGRYNNSAQSKYQLDSEEIQGILPLDSGVLVGTSGSALHIINTITDNLKGIQGSGKTNSELNQLPKSYLLAENGQLLYGNDLSHMSILNYKTGELQFKNYTQGAPVPVFDIYKDNQGFIWVSTDGNGIYLLNSEWELIQQILHDEQDPSSLPNNQPSKVIQDSEGLFWIATYNEGVCKLSMNKSAFAHVFYRPQNNEGLSARIAQAVIEDQKGRIWVGTDGGGLNLLDEHLNVVGSLRHLPNIKNTITSDKILYIEEGASGELWICTWDGGLNRLNPETRQVRRFTHDVGNRCSIAQNTVWYATQADNGVLWCGTLSAGLNAYDPAEDRFYRYNSQTIGPQLLSDLVFSLLIDSQNRLLIGTDVGLQAISLDRLAPLGELDTLPLVSTSESQLRGFRINHMVESTDGTFWVGTDLGLYHLSSDFALLNQYTTTDGLPSNLIVGVALDDDGNLWFTTKSGLSHLNTKTEEFKNFNIHDGIQGMEFQSKSIFKASDGRILAGGINGMNVFRPEEVRLPEHLGEPIISSISVLNNKIRVEEVFNDRVLLKEPIGDNSKITLNYDEGFVSFDYVGLHLSNPDRVSYAHRMIGVSDDWVFVEGNRTASYSNLISGNYRFEVKVVLDDDWDNAKLTGVDLKVLPPPWRTWWAYLIYALLIGGLTWLVFRIYSQRLREERIHELDQMKLRFFINVSHEFRTPLTLILNPVDKILSSYQDQEVVKDSALVIQRSARKLLSLVTQLLDFRKMDLGKTPLELVKGDLIKFCKDTFLLFDDLAKSKSLEFKYEHYVDSLLAYFDPDKVEKIISNLLSNAIKFTDPGGTVVMSIHTVSKNKAEYARIIVRDTGVGFKKDQLEEVFSRFFHVDSTKTGTGIGLNFTKGLVEIHEGEISVESEYGKGSSFTVEIPLDKNSYTGAQHRDLSQDYVHDPAAVLSTAYELAISDSQPLSDDVPEESLDAKSPTVLIVEDNKELRVHLRKELKAGFKVREAANGREGLEKINKFYPDIVISDVMMPEMDGFELCRKAKMNLETCHIPVILLTARSLEEDRIEGYETGADEYLPKPFNVSVLKARINNLLEAKRRLREKFTSVGGMLPSSEVTTNTLDEAFLDRVTKVILDNVSDQDFRLTELLKEMGVSRSQFYRKVSSLTGQNPSHFIRVIRLKYALDLLRKQQHSIKEVAYMSGFNSSAYFTKSFREHFGKAPNQYLAEEID